MADDDLTRRLPILEAENARLRALLDRQGMPSALRHQLRNILALMKVVIRQPAEISTSVEDYAAHLEGRFDALLRVQTLLMAAGDEGIDLHTLLADELLAYAIHDDGRATLNGPPVRLPSRVAGSLGLMLHELATNAVKYGAMTTGAGRITLNWTVTAGDPPVLDLAWIEDGLVDLPPGPSARGFGLTTLEGMFRYQLGAESAVDFLPTGLRCVMKVPLRSGRSRTHPV